MASSPLVRVSAPTCHVHLSHVRTSGATASTTCHVSQCHPRDVCREADRLETVQQDEKNHEALGGVQVHDPRVRSALVNAGEGNGL